MKYIFHLGRIPALSIAEIQAIFKKMKVNYSTDFVNSKVLILDTKNEINFNDLFPQMGGTIKISEVLGKYKNLDETFKKTISIIKELNKKRSTKKTIGYSIYFTQNEEKNKALEILKEVRKKLTEFKKSFSQNLSIRIVHPGKNMELNSASIFKNKMIKKGAEFNFLFLVSDSIILSKTIAVQDIKSYSERDYDRPGKDARIGIMPPKLAQIMINLAQIKKSEIILDPFCGIGTILQEALLNDYRIIGSDANGDQIANSKKNLEWLSEKYILEYPDYKIFQSDIKSIIKKIKRNSIDAIVTESTLGPVYKKIPSQAEIKHNYNRFAKMYTGFFQIAKLILRKKRKIVITIPAYKIKDNKYKTAPFIDRLEKIGYSVVSPLDQKFISGDIKITSRNSIIYDRPNQIVAREVIVFENE